MGKIFEIFYDLMTKLHWLFICLPKDALGKGMKKKWGKLSNSRMLGKNFLIIFFYENYEIGENFYSYRIFFRIYPIIFPILCFETILAIFGSLKKPNSTIFAKNWLILDNLGLWDNFFLYRKNYVKKIILKIERF